MRTIPWKVTALRSLLMILAAWAALMPGAPATAAAHRDPKLGLVSDIAKGTQRYLVILVTFPGVEPRQPLEGVKERATNMVVQWYQAASYGQTLFQPTVKGPYTLPRPLKAYRVSPYNFQVDPRRVMALVGDALSLAEDDGTPLNQFDVVAVIHRCHTGPGQGYGMVCYCANPGMLSKGRRRAAYVPIQTRRGTVFQKGVVVMAENFHLGFMVHDLAHAIGGVYQGWRLVPDLYDFPAQSRPRQQFHITDASVYLGPWDVMSQHFLERGQTPPGFSLFSMIRLGYLRPDQVTLVQAAATALVRLSPLAAGGPMLGVKISLSPERYLLVENRQQLNLDQVLPAAGIMIYEVDESRREGWGQVKAMNADPGAPNFSRAPFGVEGQARLAWTDPRLNVAVVPICKEGADYLVLVTDARQAGVGETVARNLALLQKSPDYDEQRSQVLELLRGGQISAAAAVSSR